MKAILEFAGQLLGSGLGNLAAYLAAHVLLCLLPAFVIAGAMTALIPKDVVTRFLGRGRPKIISYPAAALAGFLLAVCSCTVIPLFAGIYKKGAGLGPAITFLFVAPAVNILALSYTGKVLGMDLALARLLLSLVFGIGVGLMMAAIFFREDLEHDAAADALFAGQQKMRGAAAGFLLLLVALLVAGTLQVGFLKQTYVSVEIPGQVFHRVQEILNGLVPFDPAKGEEGLTAQGLLLIGLLGLMGLSAWKGIECVFEGKNAWISTFLVLLGITLMLAAMGMAPHPGGLELQFTGKFFAVTLLLGILGWMLKHQLREEEVRDMLWESWRFVKQIFPLLIIGVFAVGMIRELIQPQWIQTLAGDNTLAGNLAGVVFGVFMYFPTLVEVPIAQMFLDLGMHRGPLLAYLISDPELSLQSILITASIIGRRKAWVYVGLIAVFSTLAGLLFGAWVEGAELLQLALILAAMLAVLSAGLFLINRQNHVLAKKRDEDISESVAGEDGHQSI